MGGEVASIFEFFALKAFAADFDEQFASFGRGPGSELVVVEVLDVH